MLDKMAFDPLYKSLAVELALGYGQDGALRVVHACLQLEAVQKQEGGHRRMSYPFVPVEERVIADQRKAERRSFGREGGISFHPAGGHSGLCNSRF